jgi:hypothetical protein
MDNCVKGFPFHELNAVLIAAVTVQAAALIVACVRRKRRLPGSGLGLAGAIITSVLAVPAGSLVYLVINFDLCLNLGML